ncbi:MAG: trypsin-like serine protease [Deltaproteobacteria bacterium]|nr:trypsin-like serine protease [Deltaproteobacteria bacterium]
MRHVCLLSLFLLNESVIACRATTVDAEPGPDDARADAIYGGVADKSAHAAVVMIAHPDGDGLALCTASLIAPRVLLTAAHCVVVDSPTYVSCGGSTSDRELSAIAAATLTVHTGYRPKLESAPAARGRRIFVPKLSSLCDRDIAVVVLDRALAFAPQPLAGALPDDDTSLTAVGYGLTEHGTSGERRRREGMRILTVGPSWDGGLWLGARELETSGGPCSGDSGGPLLDEDDAIVGVVSRGGSCRRDDGNIYSSAIGHSTFIADALAWAEDNP